MAVEREINRLYDGSGVLIAEWVGFLIPPLPYSNQNVSWSYVLVIGGERFRLPVGPIERVVLAWLLGQRSA